MGACRARAGGGPGGSAVLRASSFLMSSVATCLTLRRRRAVDRVTAMDSTAAQYWRLSTIV